MITKVTWDGGEVPTGEATGFQFLGRADSSQTYTFGVRQTYSDGSVVDWNGPESSDAPAPTIEATSSFGGSGGSSTLAIVALVVGGLALVLAGVGARHRHREALAGVRRSCVVVLAAAVAALALPAAAWAHAALLRTDPLPSGTVNTPPKELRLTYTEAVEPRFAIVSVTDADARQQTAGPPRRSPENVDTLVVPLKKLSQGWYLVWWRVISADGHPVRGAFTFAVGPNAGPAPQFVIPSISETAVTPRLLVARWIVFLSVMAAIGLFVLRIGIARPLVRRVGGTRLRAVSVAFVVACAIGLVATPVYTLLATAQFALRSAWDVGALVPLIRASSFGRGFVDLELTFALFALAGLVALWVDRPERERRSIAEVLALVGALVAAGAVLLVPGLAGHAAQASPRAWALFFDWSHLTAGSLWFGGLIGLIVLWSSLPAARRIAGLAVCVPRFSNVAFVSVNVLIATGVAAALIHLPTVASLWETSYGKAILVKVALLGGAMLIAAVNLLWTRPRLQASAGDRPDIGPATATLLRRLVGSEIVHRRRDHLRGGRALEPAAAGEGPWATGERGRARRSRAGDAHDRKERLHARLQRHAEPGRPGKHVRGLDQARRPACHRRRRDR